MSVTLPTSISNRAALRPMLTARCVLHKRHAVLCAGLAALFMYVSYLPLVHTDLWGHVAWGSYILEEGRFPDRDLAMPLAAGMRVVNPQWLSQTVLAAVERAGGAAGLSVLFAIVVWSTYAILTRVFFRQTGSVMLALFGAAATLAMLWTRHFVIRPEMFGALCFAILLWLTEREADSKQLRLLTWIGVPLIMALWANLHGSFAIGLITVGCFACGNLLEAGWRHRSVLGALREPAVRHWLLLFELALAATLVNPYGLDLWVDVARFGQLENLRELTEWMPLKLVDPEGIAFAATILAAVFLLRHSQRRVRAGEVLLLVVLSVAVARHVRMIEWFAPAAMFVLLPHAADIARRWFGKAHTPNDETAVSTRELTPRDFIWTLVCGLIVWTAFAWTPISQPLLASAPRPDEHIFDHATPRGLTEFLREQPQAGLVYCPQWWGDWIAWDGPADSNVFMATNVHLAPRRVWRDYMLVAQAGSGWQRVLDRYAVATLVVDKQRQPALVRQIAGAPEWRKTYEDSQAIVWRRSAAAGRSVSHVAVEARHEH